MFLIFHVFQRISPYSRSYSVCVSFSRFSHFSSHIPGPTLCVSYFARFKCFLPYFMSYHVSFSFSLFLSFLAIFQVLLCEFLIFLFSQFSHHIPGPTVCIPHLSSFSFSFFFFAIFQVLKCVFLIFMIFSFLAIFHVLGGLF